MNRSICLVSVLAIVTTVWGQVALGQSDRGALGGHVTDSSGSVLQGADGLLNTRCRIDLISLCLQISLKHFQSIGRIIDDKNVLLLRKLSHEGDPPLLPPCRHAAIELQTGRLVEVRSPRESCLDGR